MAEGERMTVGPDLSVLDARWGEVDPESIKPVGEGVWFAWRKSTRISHPMGDVQNGMYWLHDGSKVVSLAMGTGLHSWGSVDWETYVFRPDGVDLDKCCHGSEAEAEKCALTFFAQGTWCRSWDED